jgi:hypothetical protein
MPAFVKDVDDETVQVLTAEDMDTRDERRAARGRFWIGTLATTAVAGVVALLAFGNSLNNQSSDNHRGHLSDSAQIGELRSIVTNYFTATQTSISEVKRNTNIIARKLGAQVDP